MNPRGGRVTMAGKRSSAVDAYVKDLPQEQQPIVEALRTLVLTTAPHLEEKLKWNNPTYVGKSNVCWILSYKDHVDFGFFRGTQLPNPKGLLEGTGKGLRHVKMYSMQDANNPAVKALLREAVKLDGR